MPNARRFATLGLTLAAVASGLVLSGPAAASPSDLAVTTTADTGLSAGACGDSSITRTPDSLSLREATCLADNLGGPVIINLPAGNYDLPNGTLFLEHGTHQSVTIAGAGSDATTMWGDSQSSVIQTDAGGRGGNTTVLSGLTIYGGYGGAGGGGIRNGTGSISSGERNALSLNGVTVLHNYAAGSGAGIESTDSSVSVINSKLEANLTYAGSGGGLDFHGDGSLGETLTISDTTFDGNTVSADGSGDGSIAGGGLNIDGNAPSVTIDDSQFSENDLQSPQIPAFGGAIAQHSGTLSVQRSTLGGNQVYGTAADRGGAVYVDGDSTTTSVNYSYVAYNYELPNSTDVNPSGIVNAGSGVVDAAENWWGCNAGPGNTNCDAVSGTVLASPHLTFTAAASPQHVVGPNGSATISASLRTDSAGHAVDPAQLVTFDAQSVRIGAPTGDATATSADPQYPYDAQFSAGVAPITYDSNTTAGTDSVPVTFGQASATASLEVGKPARITSATRVGLRMGRAGSFAITTGGGHQFSDMTPTATAITESGALPAGVAFTDNGDGTATLSGNPHRGTSGSYRVTFSADNGVGTPARQSFTLYATTADPTLDAQTLPRHGPTRFHWYRQPVTVQFRCVTHGAPLTAKCPSKVVLNRNGAGQSVHATIHTADGASAGATVRGVNIDRTVPTVRLTGYRNGATYYGKLPVAHCIGRDALSGVIACSIYRHRHGHVVHYTVTATDRAGNHARITGTYYRQPRR